ncbi:MAG: hypothetical protein K2J79_01950, partial [Ruminiclostridium sp.]|nr:hypothetical protein [Ruminiclostridium sp.]
MKVQNPCCGQLSGAIAESSILKQQELGQPLEKTKITNKILRFEYGIGSKICGMMCGYKGGSVM